MEETGSKGGRTRRPAAKAPAAAASRASAKPAAARTVAPKKSAAPKKAAAAPGEARLAVSGPERDAQVRIAAYFRAERRGFAPGYEVEDWLAAEAEVAARFPVPAKAAPRKPVRKPTAG